MAKKFNNIYLLILLALLMGAFLILRTTKTKKSESTFDTNLVSIDTAQIGEILLYLKAENHEEIKLYKSNEGWKVKKGNIIADAQPARIKGIISELMRIKPMRLAANSKDRWDEFQVTDSLGTRVKILDPNGKVTLDVMIGKLSFLQNPAGQGIGQGRQNNAKGISYVRLTDNDEVYAVDGYLPMAFNQEFNSWRDGTFLKSNKTDLTKITFEYPADSGFTLNLVDSVWMVDSELGENRQVQSYLNLISNRSNNAFDDSFKPETNPLYRVIIEGNNMNAIVIQGFQKPNGDLVLHSTLNPDTYVSSKSSGLAKELFKSKQSFLQ